MLIRNATADIGGVLQPGTELRIMHGVVQEIGHGLVKGMYESELDLQGDILRPGKVVIRRAVSAAELRRLYRQGVAAVITDCEPAGRIGPVSPRIIIRNPLPENVPAGLPGLGRIQPGAYAPLTRWSREGRFICAVDEHSAD